MSYHQCGAVMSLPREIPVGQVNPSEAVGMALEALHRQYPQRFWKYQGTPHYRRDDGSLERIDYQRFRPMLRVAAMVRTTKNGRDQLHELPNGLCFDAYNTLDAFPVLAGYTQAAWVDDGGRLVSDRGYDEKSGVWLRWEDDEANPEALTDEDVQEVLARLLDFTFATSSDRLNYLAALVRCVRGPAMWSAPSPMTAIVADGEASGKSLAAEVLSIVATGDFRATTMPSEAELEYKLPALLQDSAGVIWFDNIETGTKLGGPKLQAVLTSGEMVSREVRSSRTVRMDPRRFAFLATINQPDIDNETARRVVPVRLLNPEPGRRWMTNDLKEWVKHNRRLVVSALCKIVIDWHGAGAPPAPRALATFGAWSRLCGGPACAALPAARGEWLDPERQLTPGWERELDHVIRLRWKRDASGAWGPLSSAALLTIAEAGGFYDLVGLAGTGPSDKSRVTKFGVALRNFVRRGKPTPGGFMLRTKEGHDGALYWPEVTDRRGTCGTFDAPLTGGAGGGSATKVGGSRQNEEPTGPTPPYGDGGEDLLGEGVGGHGGRGGVQGSEVPKVPHIQRKSAS